MRDPVQELYSDRNPDAVAEQTLYLGLLAVPLVRGLLFAKVVCNEY
jgi:hypothetical protein